jgi:hypothetical protein
MRNLLSELRVFPIGFSLISLLEDILQEVGIVCGTLYSNGIKFTLVAYSEFSIWTFDGTEGNITRVRVRILDTIIGNYIGCQAPKRTDQVPGSTESVGCKLHLEGRGNVLAHTTNRVAPTLVPIVGMQKLHGVRLVVRNKKSKVTSAILLQKECVACRSVCCNIMVA